MAAAGPDRIPDVARRVAERAEVTEHLERDRIVLERRRYGPAGRAVARLLRMPTTFTLRLDELGTATWRLIDGQRTVGDIRVALQQQFPQHQELAQRLGAFVGMLVSRGFARLR